MTKLAAEQLCRVYHANHGVDTVALRFFTVYGPRQRPDMAFRRFCEAAAHGAPIELFGDGRQSRDFTYVDDVVDAILAAGAHAPAGTQPPAAGGGSPAAGTPTSGGGGAANPPSTAPKPGNDGQKVPEVKVPPVKIPPVHVPSVEVPSVKVPSVEVPAIKLPCVDLPGLP